MSQMPDPLTFVPEASNSRLLRDAFGRFATGVTVVTCGSDVGPIAITANSFSSVSMEPPLVLWSPSRASRRFPYFEAARNYAIHVLSVEQSALCDAVSKNAYALTDFAHTVNSDGVPLLDGALARFVCHQRAVYDGGDHAIILGEVKQASFQDGTALAFYAGKMGQIAQS
jgi:flavin reductase (DIM6/NTAB) family NADH-FMN oxidoreductase RutF